jgi:prolipoprotein diacylglyceryltransferase
MLPLVHIGAFELRLWPLCATAGVLLCWGLLLRRTARLGYRSLLVFLWVLLAFPIGALCAAAVATGVARLLGEQHAEGDGLSVTGSVIGCLAFSVVYVGWVFRGQRPWRLLDAVAFTFGLATAVGRIGCLFNGCCYGQDASFSLTPITIPSQLLHLAPSRPLWNLAVLLSLNALLAMGVAEWLWARRERLRLRDGTVFFAAIACDAIGRSAIETVRHVDGPRNPWQAIAIGIAVFAALGTWWRASLRSA